MSEEESFVILGSSPNESMENYTIVNNSNSVQSQHDTNVDIVSSNLLDSLRSDSAYKTNHNDNSMTVSSGNFSMLNGSPVLGTTEEIGENLREGPISKHVDIWSTSGAIEQQNNIQEIKTSKTSADFSMVNGNSVHEHTEEIDGSVQEGLVSKYTDIWCSSAATEKPNNENDLKANNTTFLGGSTSSYHSMATSFSLGKSESESIKTNVYTEFPSLCGSQAKMEDIRKLQKFMIEYEEMKYNIRKTNASMRQQFTMIQKWQTEVSTFKEIQEKRFVEYEQAMAKLKTENLEIKNELNDKIEQIKLNEKWMKKENEDLVKLVSEKSSIIENMGFQIEKLEQNQNFSFEYVRGNKSEEPQHEYIRLSEHKTMLKDFEKKMDNILSEKLELQDMKNIYIDELNCLKVNLTSAEELLKQYRVEIDILKTQDTEKTNVLKKFEEEKTEMKQEIEVLKMQIEWYRKDFEVERSAKDNLATEKEQLLADLKMLQRRNHQMIEEAAARMEIADEATPPTAVQRRTGIQLGNIKKYFHETPKSSSNRLFLSSTTARTPKPTRSQEETPTEDSFICPLCRSTFNCLDRLEAHVQQCLDN